MTEDMLFHEKILWAQGCKNVAGVDEAGRGPLAGPVVAACVILDPENIPEGVDVGRHLTLEFTIEQVSGFGIPKEAVRMQDDISGVYTYNGVVVKFRKIDILAEYDDMYIAAVRDNTPEQPPVPAESTTGDNGEDTPPETEELGDGTGRKVYSWLEAHEFIVVKGKALYHGRVIG